MPPFLFYKTKSITFQTWLLETKAKGEKAVSDYQPVWDYAKLTGIPEDWIEIAWLRFKERYTGEEKAKKTVHRLARRSLGCKGKLAWPVVFLGEDERVLPDHRWRLC